MKAVFVRIGNGSLPEIGWGVLFLALLLNFFVWSYSSPRLPRWENVPPAPSKTVATAAFLGDEELAFRFLAISVQSFGNSTGQVAALKDYNYNNLGTWFRLGDSLNKRSDYLPFLAGYYFGAGQDSTRLMPVIDYLRTVGTYPYPEKWRYLGQAIFLARHRMNDMKLAYRLADELASVYKPGMPAWTLQMKAIIASDMGEKEMAYNLMTDILQQQGRSLDPAEVSYMKTEICTHLLDKAARDKNPICR